MGTDTSGSIRIPSSHNSIVGLRPSLGLSSRAGIIPFGHTQDTGGPMARTVEDIAVILDATVGYDAADSLDRREQRTATSNLCLVAEDRGVEECARRRAHRILRHHSRGR
jgi:Asp-tRNA(Asn)/Glu-tRNA(Gln) amidotransferase A subunit family amidase